MTALGAFGGKPSRLSDLVAHQERLSHSGTDRHKSPPLWRFALVDEVAVVCPVQVFPAHPEHLLPVAHSGITHDHHHIAKRLFAERQKLGFDVSVDNALPRLLLHELDLRSSLDHVPLFGLSEHPPQGAESIVMVSGTAGERQSVSVISRDRTDPHRRHFRPFEQSPAVRVIVFGFLLELGIALDPFKKPGFEITQHRATPSEKYFSFFLSLREEQRFHSSRRRLIPFLR